MKKNKIGLVSAIFLGVSSILGSGWLFAPYKAAQEAGPASIYSWIVGAIAISLLALCFAEVASIYPFRGLSAIVATLSHNRFFGFPFAICNWLGVVAVISLEATATIQYLINLFPKLEYLFFAESHLTFLGTFLAIALVFLFCLVNFWGASVLAKTNNILTVVKVIVPVVTVLMIVSVAFHSENFSIVKHSFVPYGAKSIFTAILTTGIIIAFNGFQTVISFASEVKKPHRTIPLAILITIVFCLLVYLALQIAFIGAIPTGDLSEGWHKLQYSAPMVELSVIIGLGMLTSIIYFGATISPSGAAIAFTGTSARMFTAMARNQQMPRYFDSVHTIYHVSRRSLVMNALLSSLFLIVFRSWSQLAEILSLFHVLSYIPIPLALCVLRKSSHVEHYPFRLFFGRTISFIVFILFTALLTISSSQILLKVTIALICIQAIFLIFTTKTFSSFLSAIKQCYLIFLYFICLVIFTYFSPQHNSETHINVFFGAVFVFSCIAFFILTMRQDKAQKEFEEVKDVYSYGAK